MLKDKRSDRVSEGLMNYLNKLNPQEREELIDALRQPGTYIAENLDDLLTIVKEIKKQNDERSDA